MCAQERLDPLAASLRDGQPYSLKLLRSYPEVVIYLFKNNATDQAIAEYDATILRYVQLKNMTPQQFADDLIAKRYKVATVNDKSTLNNVIIEGVDASIRNSSRNY